MGLARRQDGDAPGLARRAALPIRCCLIPQCRMSATQTRERRRDGRPFYPDDRRTAGL